MLISLGLVTLALRAGLAMRRRRQRSAPPDIDLLKRHLAMAKPGVVLALLGFVGGLVSSVQLRAWNPLETFHGGVAVLVVIMFSITAILGRQVEKGEGSPSMHGLMGVLAFLGASLAAVAGFVLLP